RGGSQAAEEAWQETGVDSRLLRKFVESEIARQGNKETRRHGQKEASNGEAVKVYAEGMLVRHELYGQGRVTQVSGYGVIRKIKVRFSSHGEKTFVVEKAKFVIVGRQ